MNSHFPTEPVVEELQRAGMCPVGMPLPVSLSDCYPVLLDGRLIGYMPDIIASDVVAQLRLLKISCQKRVRYLNL